MAADEPLCTAADVAVTVRWEQDGSGLRGQVIAENVGSRACRLAGKPRVTPLRADGARLPVRNTITLEWVPPGYALLRPGQRAAARLAWSSWCGEPAGDQALVEWEGGTAMAKVHGPTQPDCVDDRPTNLNPYWFFLTA